MTQHYKSGLNVMLPSISTVLSYVMPDDSVRPMTFASQSLTKTERKYAHIEFDQALQCMDYLGSLFSRKRERNAFLGGVPRNSVRATTVDE